MRTSGIPYASANNLVRVGSTGVQQQSKQVQLTGELFDFFWAAVVDKRVHARRSWREVLSGDSVLYMACYIYLKP